MVQILPCDVLLICATDKERDSLLSLVKHQTFHGKKNSYYNLEIPGGIRVYLLRCEIGIATPGGSLVKTNDAINECSPRYIIMYGIAFGMYSDKQQIGQILVASEYTDYDPERIGTDDEGEPISIRRGVRIPADEKILGVLRSVSPMVKPAPIFGLMVSGSKLIDNEEFKKKLLGWVKEAVGGDMEIHGMVMAAYRNNIPWGAAKAICDFADGLKSKNKDEYQIKAADASARFILQSIVSNNPFSPEGAPNLDHSFEKRIQELGLVDIALYRDDLTCDFIAKSLGELIDSMFPQSEFFIVARSLELWLKIPKGRTEPFLVSLARRVVQQKLRCILVLPDNDPNLKSLVLSDPSQGVQTELWENIEITLKEVIDDVASKADNPDPNNGFIEVYTIPAYIPSTFSKIATNAGKEYCSLEVGIGIPPEDARVYLYFENKPGKMCIFERLDTIHKKIISERRPVFKFPQWKNRPPESKELLNEEYKSLLSHFTNNGVDRIHCIQNRDFYSSDEKMQDGEAAVLTTVPLDKYYGGVELIRLVHETLDKVKKLVDQYSQEAHKFHWLSDKDLFIPIFYYKSTFHKNFRFPKQEAQELVHCLGNMSPFSILFQHFAIDKYGTVALLGYPQDDDSLSKIRDMLLHLVKIKHKRYDARRPQLLKLRIGTIENLLDTNFSRKLQQLTQDLFYLSSIIKVEIDQVRLIKLKGTYSDFIIDDVLKNPVILKTKLLEADRSREYGVLSTGKWLAHSDVVNKVKRLAFDEIRPVTVHFCPSLQCIYNCPTCSYGSYKDLNKSTADEVMSKKDMISCIDKLAKGGVKGLIFTGGGEPLTNQHCAEGIKHAKLRGFSVGLFTNGYLLDSNTCNELFSDKEEILDFIRFSINAGSNKSYQLIHGSPSKAFEVVLQNLERVCQTKLRLAAKVNLDVGVLVSPALLDNLIDLAIELKRLALKYPGAINNVLFRPTIRYMQGCRNNEYTRQLENCPNHGMEYRQFFKNKKQFQDKTFNSAKKIIKDQIAPLLMEKNESNVNVFWPEERFKMATSGSSKREDRKCFACNLVGFVAPDTHFYSCVEQALDPSFSLGKINEVRQFVDLWPPAAQGKSAPQTQYCPPVCLLYETNVSWNKILKKFEADSNKDRHLHSIEIAREYFDRNVLDKLGGLVNFI